MDTIDIDGIEFYGFHGAFDEEQVIGHTYRVDVELRLDLRRAGESDSLDDTVNYAAVAARILEIGHGERVRLLETLAERMTAAIVAEFPVDSVRLRVGKVRPPMGVLAESVSVTIERRRNRQTDNARET